MSRGDGVWLELWTGECAGCLTAAPRASGPNPGACRRVLQGTRVLAVSSERPGKVKFPWTVGMRPKHGHLSLEEGGRKAVFCGQRRRRPPECTRWDQRGRSGAKGAQPLGGARNRPLPPEPLGCLGLGGTRLQPGGADFRLLGPRAVPPGNKFLLFSGTQFGVICYSHPRTLPDSAVLDVSSAQKLLGAHLWVRLLRMDKDRT